MIVQTFPADPLEARGLFDPLDYQEDNAMTRAEHNTTYPDHAMTAADSVQCNILGRGDTTDHYDAQCAPCYHGHTHSWARHDESIQWFRSAGKRPVDYLCHR